MKDAHAHIVLIFCLWLFSFIQVQAQSTESSTFEQYMTNPACPKEEFLYGRLDAFNLDFATYETRDSVPTPIEFVLAFKVDALGDIVEVTTHLVRSSDLPFVNQEKVANSLAKLKWPVCDLPFKLDSGTWQIVIPQSMYHTSASTHHDQNISMSSNLKHLTLKIAAEHPSIISPPLILGFKFN